MHLSIVFLLRTGSECRHHPALKAMRSWIPRSYLLGARVGEAKDPGPTPHIIHDGLTMYLVQAAIQSLGGNYATPAGKNALVRQLKDSSITIKDHSQLAGLGVHGAACTCCHCQWFTEGHGTPLSGSRFVKPSHLPARHTFSQLVCQPASPPARQTVSRSAKEAEAHQWFLLPNCLDMFLMVWHT